VTTRSISHALRLAPITAALRPRKNRQLVRIIDMQTIPAGSSGLGRSWVYDLRDPNAPIAPIKSLWENMRANGLPHQSTHREGHRPDMADLAPQTSAWRSRADRGRDSATASTRQDPDPRRGRVGHHPELPLRGRGDHRKAWQGPALIEPISKLTCAKADREI